MIKIVVATYDNIAQTPPISALFDRQRRSLGRGEGNFLVLADPKNEVARLQAGVWSDGARHVIVNLSKTTPISINGRAIAAERETELRIGDLIQVGSYVLRVDDPANDEADASAQAAAADAATSAELQALKDAFLRGARLPGSALASALTPELMEMLGQVLAASVQGTIDLMAHRTLVKQEVKTDMTMVVIRNNNPLKFFQDSETVLMQMLRKKMPGFMQPQEAVVDAFHDLRSHQLAVVAGMRATMRANADALLAQFRPGQFASSTPPTLGERLVPSKRTAAMWSRYQAHFAATSEAPTADFKNVFGAPFQAAYEFEIERLLRPYQRD